jgi:hypothetical protein
MRPSTRAMRRSRRAWSETAVQHVPRQAARVRRVQDSCDGNRWWKPNTIDDINRERTSTNYLMRNVRVFAHTRPVTVLASRFRFRRGRLTVTDVKEPIVTVPNWGRQRLCTPGRDTREIKHRARCILWMYTKQTHAVHTVFSDVPKTCINSSW